MGRHAPTTTTAGQNIVKPGNAVRQATAAIVQGMPAALQANAKLENVLAQAANRNGAIFAIAAANALIADLLREARLDTVRLQRLTIPRAPAMKSVLLPTAILARVPHCSRTARRASQI